MRHRDAAGERRGERARHAGHDIDVDAVRMAGQVFLPPAAEQVRIAALEAHHPPPGPRLTHENRVDLALRNGVMVRALADVDDLGAQIETRQFVPRAKAIGDDDVRLLELAQGTQRQQVERTRSAADEDDAPRRDCVAHPFLLAAALRVHSPTLGSDAPRPP